MNIHDNRPVRPHTRTSACSEADVFKPIGQLPVDGYFASARARMEAASSANPTPLSFDDQYINAPLLTQNKTHFDFDEVGVLFFARSFI